MGFTLTKLMYHPPMAGRKQDGRAASAAAEPRLGAVEVRHHALRPGCGGRQSSARMSVRSRLDPIGNIVLLAATSGRLEQAPGRPEPLVIAALLWQVREPAAQVTR
jgi:hypothetical protein